MNHGDHSWSEGNVGRSAAPVEEASFLLAQLSVINAALR